MTEIANPIGHLHFHPRRAAIGKQTVTAHPRRVEYGNDLGQRSFGIDAHIHGLSGERNSINADHRTSLEGKRRWRQHCLLTGSL